MCVPIHRCRLRSWRGSSAASRNSELWAVASVRPLGLSSRLKSVDPALRAELLTVLPALERLRQEMREVVKVNRISWESADVETAP